MKKRKNPKAFISYSTKDKEWGHRVKGLLSKMGVDSFLAHDDLAVSEEWQHRIREELATCQLFVALISESFRDSAWAPQEVGIAVSRDGLQIVPISLDGTLPFGFIGKIQGAKVTPYGVPVGALAEPLLKGFPRHAIPAFIASLKGSMSFRNSEAWMEPLVPFFKNFSVKDVDSLVDVSIENFEIWSATLCRTEYLPLLIRVHRKKIDVKKLEILEYQLRTNLRFGEQ